MKTRDGFEMTTVPAEKMVGNLVRYWCQGRMMFFGVAEYLTPDGWLGIRQAGGYLDEAPAAMCDVDPT